MFMSNQGSRVARPTAGEQSVPALCRPAELGLRKPFLRNIFQQKVRSNGNKVMIMKMFRSQGAISGQPDTGSGVYTTPPPDSCYQVLCFGRHSRLQWRCY